MNYIIDYMNRYIINYIGNMGTYLRYIGAATYCRAGKITERQASLGLIGDQLGPLLYPSLR